MSSQNTIQSWNASEFKYFAYNSQPPQGVTVRMTLGRCFAGIQLHHFHARYNQHITGKDFFFFFFWIKKLINICSFTFVKCSPIRIIKSGLKLLSTSLTTKWNFKWKGNIWSLRWEALLLHLFYSSSPLWLTTGHQISPNEGLNC